MDIFVNHIYIRMLSKTLSYRRWAPDCKSTINILKNRAKDNKWMNM